MGLRDAQTPPAQTSRKSGSYPRIKLAATILVVLFLASEAAIRLSGLIDFPTYSADDRIGYMINPNQSGKFLEKNAWIFNNRGMGVAEPWNPALRPNLLLIGNSVVMGGNPYNQPDKLGPRLQALEDGSFAVWPIAVGGWSDVNETVYLEENPDVAASANFFVWEYMAGGLTGLSQWRGDYVFPRSPPACATWYVLRRYVLPKFIRFNMSELPPTGDMKQANFARFEAEIAILSKATPQQCQAHQARGESRAGNSDSLPRQNRLPEGQAGPGMAPRAPAARPNQQGGWN